jgi:aspartate racemase
VQDLPFVTEYLVEAVAVLARAGASMGLIAANTPHIVFHDVQLRSSIPLVSIVEAACEHVRKRGFRRVALFGTRFTMEGRRRCLLQIVDRLVEQKQVEAVILGGTELPLVLPDASHRGVPLLDTTRIHVDAALGALRV